jgi:serine/threonine protein kinase
MNRPLSDLVVDLREYIKIKKCGSGAFSAVFRYQDKTHPERHYAVKRMDKDIDKAGTQLMFFREITILLALQHPTILPFQVFTLPTEGDQSFQIITKFMTNSNVQQHEDWENEGRCNPTFNATTKSKIIYGTAVGMKFIHDNHIVHRDLKAENIFLNEDWEPVIADFGLSKQIDAELVISGTMGTPYYMAPELFDSEGQTPSYPIDVYAYAIIVLSLFTKGQFRFPESKIMSLPQLASGLARGKRFQVPANVPERYRELITRCWEQDPPKRFRFDDVVNFLDGAIDPGGDPLMIPGADLGVCHNYRLRVRDWKPAEPVPGDASRPDTEPFRF